MPLFKGDCRVGRIVYRTIPFIYHNYRRICMPFSFVHLTERKYLLWCHAEKGCHSVLSVAVSWNRLVIMDWKSAGMKIWCFLAGFGTKSPTTSRQIACSFFERNGLFESFENKTLPGVGRWRDCRRMCYHPDSSCSVYCFYRTRSKWGTRYLIWLFDSSNLYR